MKTKCKAAGCYEPTACRHGYCGRHCPRNHPLRDYHGRKYPRNMRPHIGVELEVEFANERDRKQALPLGGHYDGSLGDVAAEFKLLAETPKAAKRAAALALELWERRALVTRACGLHVHVDARQLEEATLVPFFGWLRATEQHWYSLMPPSRRDSAFVRRLRDSATIPHDHYEWAHVTRYRTVEIRLHASTLNPYKIAAWVDTWAWLQGQLATRTDWPQAQPDRSAKALFWDVMSGAPDHVREYLRAREERGGVLRDYSFERVGSTNGEQ